MCLDRPLLNTYTLPQYGHALDGVLCLYFVLVTTVDGSVVTGALLHGERGSRLQLAFGRIWDMLGSGLLARHLVVED